MDVELVFDFFPFVLFDSSPFVVFDPFPLGAFDFFPFVELVDGGEEEEGVNKDEEEDEEENEGVDKDEGGDEELLEVGYISSIDCVIKRTISSSDSVAGLDVFIFFRGGSVDSASEWIN